MSDRVETVVVVTDKGSQTFLKVGDSATKMGTSIDKAGTTGSKSLGSLSKAGAAAGVAFTALGATLGVAARLNAEAEASQARLETAIENTGHSMFEYEDALNAASEAALQLGFDDEDAADSIAALTAVTNDAGRAIDDLSLAEDIARARNISLQAATKLVIAAENERFGALARVGIVVDDTMTKEQALDALRSKFAGNAEAYAETEAGAMDRRKNQIENYLESVGAALGPTQQLLMLAPGLSAGFSGVGAAVGALAPNLTKAAAASSLLSLAIGPVGLVAVLGAAAAAMIYFSDTGAGEFVPAVEAANSAIGDLNATVEEQIQLQLAQAPLGVKVRDSLNYIAGAAGNYETELNRLTEAQSAAVTGLATLEAQGGKNSDLWNTQKELVDATTKALNDYAKQQGTNEVNAKLLADASAAANAVLADTGPAGNLARDTLQRLYDAQQAGILTWDDYLARIVDLGVQLPIMNDNMTTAAKGVDDTTAATEKGTAAADAYAASLVRATDGVHNLGIGFRDLGEAGDASNTTLVDSARAQNEAAAAARDHEAALKEQMGGFYGLADGIITASDAQSAFKATQDGILASQEPFNHQLSEYNGQLDNLQAAEDLLNERRAAGIPITAEQEDFLTRVDTAQQRLQGGTEDATLALGEQALQYAENMRIGDELNQNMGDTADATSALDQTIQNLILALQGIPGYVSTYIDVDAQNAINQTDHIRQQLDNLNGRTSYANVVVTGYYTGPNVGFTTGQLGGVIPHAQHGMLAGDSSLVQMNEVGGEVVRLPNGSLIYPHGASKEMARGGGGVNYNIQNMTIVANDPREFADKMRAYSYASQR